MERLSKAIILVAIYKHKALSVAQLQTLLDVKSRATISSLITRYRKANYIIQHKTPIGVYYTLTMIGAKEIGYYRKTTIKGLNEIHTDWEIRTIRHLIKTKEIASPKSYLELLNSYKTEREIKRDKFAELGGIAHKLRYIDLLVFTKEGSKAYEIEITRKAKDRYPSIIAKLDTQFSKDNWKEIIWVVHKRDVTWFGDVITNNRPTSAMSLQIIEELKW